MLKRKPPAQLELFVSGSLEQLVSDVHILACADRVLDTAGGTPTSAGYPGTGSGL